MRYVTDIPSMYIDTIQQLIKEDRYRSVQDFILTACQNQIYLEQEKPLDIADGLQNPIEPVSNPPNGNRVLQLTSLNLEVPTVETPEHAPDVMWGQWNRYFPVKLATRVLANLLKEKGSNTVPLGVLHESAADTARQYGKVIAKKDRELGRKRGGILAAGLPVGNEDKAKLRFKMQFVGYLSKDKLEGAGPTLRFINIKKDNGTVVAGLTEYGLKFASLENPILDRNDFSSPFYDAEVNFLLDHVKNILPQEAEVNRFVLQKITSGIATPDKLDEEFKKFKPEWKGSEASSMRSGLISRLIELGLIRRDKEGVKVSYALTKRGYDFLKT